MSKRNKKKKTKKILRQSRLNSNNWNNMQFILDMVRLSRSLGTMKLNRFVDKAKKLNRSMMMEKKLMKCLPSLVLLIHSSKFIRTKIFILILQISKYQFRTCLGSWIKPLFLNTLTLLPTITHIQRLKHSLNIMRYKKQKIYNLMRWR